MSGLTGNQEITLSIIREWNEILLETHSTHSTHPEGTILVAAISKRFDGNKIKNAVFHRIPPRGGVSSITVRAEIVLREPLSPYVVVTPTLDIIGCHNGATARLTASENPGSEIYFQRGGVGIGTWVTNHPSMNSRAKLKA